MIFVPGNHDEVLPRTIAGGRSPASKSLREAMHENGRWAPLLVIHGDHFDGVIAYAKWLAHAGRLGLHAGAAAQRRCATRCAACSACLLVAVGLSEAEGEECGRVHLPFRGRCGARGRRRAALDGVVCGHIHHATIRRIGGVLYLNDGDWVESCTALVEDARGNLEILHWAACRRDAHARRRPSRRHRASPFPPEDKAVTPASAVPAPLGAVARS